jgi:uncharacterized protein (DUF362 family)
MPTRREFLAGVAAGAAVAVGAAALGSRAEAAGEAAKESRAAKSRVVVIRHDALAKEGRALDEARVREILDEAARALAGDAKAADAWARWLKPSDRVAVKVNCLGYPTGSALAMAFVRAVGAAEVAPQRLIIWDRTCRELKAAGYELRSEGRGARCFGTDALERRGNGGYTEEICSSGEIGSSYSRIVTDEATALVSAPVLKDHNLAGLSCGLKNFYGAIHNPNKYHDNGCDPFVADVAAHANIRDRLRLVVCDATVPQFNGGPPPRGQWQWVYGGVLLGTDPVAVDLVASEILARKRAAAGMKSLEADGRPVRYLKSAEARGLGVADLARIEVVSIGKSWQDVS